MDDILEDLMHDADPLHIILSGGSVVRYHCIAGMQKQRVDTHSWRVQSILLYLWPGVSRQLLVAAHYHDTAEGIIGDISAPIKRHPELTGPIHHLEDDVMKALNLTECVHLLEQDELKLKCADYLECCITCLDAGSRGSNSAKSVYVRAHSYVTGLAARLPAEDCGKVMDFLTLVDGDTYSE